LTKLPDQIIDEKEKWGALFKAETEEELKALMAEFNEFNEAGEKLLNLSEEKYAQEIARAREESQWAWKHTLYHTEKYAREEERAKIKEQIAESEEQVAKAEKQVAKAEEEKLESATSLLQSGMPAEEIAKHLKLPIDVVKDLAI